MSSTFNSKEEAKSRTKDTKRVQFDEVSEEEKKQIIEEFKANQFDIIQKEVEKDHY